MTTRRVLLMMAAALMLAAGCSSAGSTSGSGSTAGSGGSSRVEKPDLTVAVVPSVDSAGFFVALHQGLFTAAGLHVTFVPAVSSETSISAQVAGKYDITAGNYVSYIEAQQQGRASLDIFAEGDVMGQGAMGLYTRPDSPIKTLA